jgi:TonB-dependent SusC/RagA subfamily outer membrane receptor
MKKTVMLFIAALLSGKMALCQQGGDPVAGAIANLRTLLTDHISEKAWLQFDRPYGCYATGEVIYFKAYVTMGEKHEPSAISTVLHVDLIDPQNVVAKSVALPLQNGVGNGDFALGDTLQKGSYRIRAYTEWMRNDKDPRFFEQPISVSSPNGQYSGQNAAQAAKPDIQFFPEGGDLVTDLPSRVAFKAIGTNGLGIYVKGVIVDNENKEVAAVNSSHLGMGIFRFIPEEGKTYTAKITFANGMQSSIPLPPARQKGLTLTVNTNDPSKVSISIRANHNYFTENKNQDLNLLIYYAGAIKRYTPKLESSVLGLDLPASSFPTGIIKVTLLSAAGEPLNERLAFIQNKDVLNLSATASKTTFSPRENVTLNFTASDKNGIAAAGSFSVSVVDESKILVDDNAESTILSYILLSSELKGYIEKPNYYFANITDQTRTDLDILMLTQGYRRFSWKELMHGQIAADNAFKAEHGLDVSGALKTKSGDPISNCSLTLIPVEGGAPQVTVTDNNGNFAFKNVPFWGGSKFVLKAAGPAAKKSVLSLNEPFDKLPAGAADQRETPYNAMADLLTSSKTPAASEAFAARNVSEKALSGYDKASHLPAVPTYRSSTLGGPGHADQVVLADRLKTASDLVIGLNGVLRDVYFYNGVPYLNSSQIVQAGSQSAEPMLVFVDGVDLGSGADITTVNPRDVEAVEVLKGSNAAIYGVEGGAGVMVITTKAGGVSTEPVSTEMSPGIFSVQPSGFYKPREFYIPKYNAATPGLSDQRTTVFWKPDLATDNSGTATVNFFNTDSKGTYRVEVQGMDKNGNLGFQVFRYKVE